MTCLLARLKYNRISIIKINYKTEHFYAFIENMKGYEITQNTHDMERYIKYSK